MRLNNREISERGEGTGVQRLLSLLGMHGMWRGVACGVAWLLASGETLRCPGRTPQAWEGSPLPPPRRPARAQKSTANPVSMGGEAAAWAAQGGGLAGAETRAHRLP